MGRRPDTVDQRSTGPGFSSATGGGRERIGESRYPRNPWLRNPQAAGPAPETEAAETEAAEAAEAAGADEARDSDAATGAAASRPCTACRGTGQVISNLGGEPHSVTCPWCDGGRVFLPGHDAQAARREAAEPSKQD